MRLWQCCSAVLCVIYRLYILLASTEEGPTVEEEAL
jgi:hypothetical protein